MERLERIIPKKWSAIQETPFVTTGQEREFQVFVAGILVMSGLEKMIDHPEYHEFFTKYSLCKKEIDVLGHLGKKVLSEIRKKTSKKYLIGTIKSESLTLKEKSKKGILKCFFLKGHKEGTGVLSLADVHLQDDGSIGLEIKWHGNCEDVKKRILAAKKLPILSPYKILGCDAHFFVVKMKEYKPLNSLYSFCEAQEIVEDLIDQHGGVRLHTEVLGGDFNQDIGDRQPLLSSADGELYMLADLRPCNVGIDKTAMPSALTCYLSESLKSIYRKFLF